MANHFVFGLVLMIETGINPVKPMAASTTVYMLPPAYETSEKCQEVAREYNKYHGQMFTGYDKTPYEGIKGPIVGAWCTIPPTLEKK